MRPKPLPARTLAMLAALAEAEAHAALSPNAHANLSDRILAPRDVTDEDRAESARLAALAKHLERRARRARWSGSVWNAFDEEALCS